MSRIGKLPVEIPATVKVQIEGSLIKVEGPKGKLQKNFGAAPVNFKFEENQVTVDKANNSRHANAMTGTARSIIAGMVKGVQEEYVKVLTIIGVGFRANLNGDILDLALGYSHPINYKVPAGIKIVISEDPARNPVVTVSGCDKQMVGQVAKDIYHYYPVEPYKGKGVRIAGQHIIRKEGKKTA